MNAWHRGPMFVFDTETSGTDVNLDRIVTATVAFIDPGKPIDPSTWLIDPGIPIPAGATAVHGISTEQARAEGQPPSEVIPLIAQRLEWAACEGIPVVAFNASFDFSILDRECRRLDTGRRELACPEPFVIDPFVMDKKLDPYRRGKRTLSATCAHYQVALNGAHDATQDALAAGRVAWRMCERWPRELQIPLGELHEKQACWRDAWAVEFQTYLRTKKGEPDAVVNGEWPVQSLPDGWDPSAVPAVQAMAS